MTKIREKSITTQESQALQHCFDNIRHLVILLLSNFRAVVSRLSGLHGNSSELWQCDLWLLERIGPDARRSKTRYEEESMTPVMSARRAIHEPDF